MLKAVITIGCAAAMIAAGVATFTMRHSRRTPSPLTGGEPFGERLAVTVSRTAGMVFGALVAGVFTIGAGGRLMMRALAVTSPDAVQGARTEADATIGAVTADGSFFLIVIVGIGASLIGLALFSILRRWLPDRSVAAGLTGVAIGAGLLIRPVGLLTSANRDFTVVAPSALAVGFCLVTLALFGATFGVGVDRFAPRWPRPGLSVRGVASVLPFVVLLFTPPLLVATVVGVLAGTFAPKFRSPTTPGRPSALAAAGAGDRGGRIAVMAFGGLGLLSIVVAAGQVLAL